MKNKNELCGFCKVDFNAFSFLLRTCRVCLENWGVKSIKILRTKDNKIQRRYE